MIAEIITLEHELWPQHLHDLDDPPLQLWASGDLKVLTRPMVAVVGSRACTDYGQRVAADITAGVSGRFTVVSGGAFGIDSVAHRMALANRDKTVVVLADGMDHMYPVANHELFRQVVDQGGAIITEYAPDTLPSRASFLHRNRVIAALSSGVVVVEAGRRSGTLNTARHAKSLGRPLMAVPGPVTSLQSVGCHDLIQGGAHLVTGAQDVLDIITDDALDRLVDRRENQL